MSEPAPTVIAARQPTVSPEAAPASPSPVSASEQPPPEQRAAQQPVSPASPEFAQPQPVRIPQQQHNTNGMQQHHNTLGMRPPTLYVDPVDPSKAAESTAWKRVKFVMVAAALVLALAAMGLSLATLKFPLGTDITRTHSFIASTVPLVSGRGSLMLSRSKG